MATKESRYLAATAWCKPTTSHIEMNGDLAEAFAEIIDSIQGTPTKYDKLIDELYFKWGVGNETEQRLRFWNSYFPNTNIYGCQTPEQTVAIFEMQYLVAMCPEDLIFV